MRTIFLGPVDSTNISALRYLNQGEATPFLIQAAAQTGGRGRGGKDWHSPEGNFYGTFALRPQRPEGESAQLSFVAALALAQMLESMGINPQLKWPNDVLIGGAKLSGILLEKHGAHILIGMGLIYPAIQMRLAIPAQACMSKVWLWMRKSLAKAWPTS